MKSSQGVLFLLILVSAALTCSCKHSEPVAKSSEERHVFPIQTYDGTWGFINDGGDIIIDPVYDFLLNEYATFGYSMAVTREGIVVYDRQGEVRYKLAGKWDRFLCRLVNESILVACDGTHAYVYDFVGDKLIFDCGSIAEANLIHFYPLQKDSGYIKVPKADRFGWIDEAGKVLIDFVYEDAKNMEDGFAAVMRDGKWGVIDSKGNVQLALTFDSIEKVYWPKGDFVVAGKDGRYALYDKTGKAHGEEFFDRVRCYDDHISVRSEGSETSLLLTLSGKAVLSGYYWVVPDLEGEGGYIVKEPAGQFHIDREVKSSYEQRFFWISRYNDGLAPVQSTEVSLKGYVGKDGEFLIEPRFIKARPFSEGYAGVSIPDGDEIVHGYVNQKGEVVIRVAKTTKRMIDRVKLRPFKYGLAWVETPEKMGYIDTRGQWVWKAVRK